MPQILGYGEDALTLWALGQQLATILERLDDQTSPDKALVFYRPSFGRGQRYRVGENVRIAAFGEFDAIIGTEKGVYLVESKWEGSQNAVPDGRIKLRDKQIQRHRIFQWYRTKWREHRAPQNWDEFRKQSIEEFQRRFVGNTMPKAGDRLAQNLRFVLDQLQSCGSMTINVLLFLHFSENPTVREINKYTIPGADAAGFRFLVLRAIPLPGSIYLNLTLRDREMAKVEAAADP